MLKRSIQRPINLAVSVVAPAMEAIMDTISNLRRGGGEPLLWRNVVGRSLILWTGLVKERLLCMR
jgi:hypothetical protein